MNSSARLKTTREDMATWITACGGMTKPYESDVFRLAVNLCAIGIVSNNRDNRWGRTGMSRSRTRVAVIIGGAPVIRPDVEAFNGVVHVIGGVLNPKPGQ